MRTQSIVMMILALCAAPAALAQQDLRTISTSGEAIIYVVPDEMVISFGVEVFDKDLDRARTENDQRSQKVLRAIREHKIEEKDIQTASIQIDPQYSDRRQETPSIVGYTARRTYAITLRDVKLFDRVVDSALKSGANRMHGFEARTSELRKHRDAARSLAIKAAREKAVALAGELSCKVGAPRTINEGSAGHYSYNWNRNAFGNVAQNAGFVGGDGGGETPLGQITIRAEISVTFDLVPVQ